MTSLNASPEVVPDTANRTPGSSLNKGAIPFITESATADFVCVAATSVARHQVGDFANSINKGTKSAFADSVMDVDIIRVRLHLVDCW